jgi:hypothetical protein
METLTTGPTAVSICRRWNWKKVCVAKSAVENAADGFDGEEGKVAEVARKGDEPVT